MLCALMWTNFWISGTHCQVAAIKTEFIGGGPQMLSNQNEEKLFFNIIVQCFYLPAGNRKYQREQQVFWFVTEMWEFPFFLLQSWAVKSYTFTILSFFYKFAFTLSAELHRQGNDMQNTK